ncbi:MAG: hypothetical protein ACMG6S_08675 [Byssovorax sp.]
MTSGLRRGARTVVLALAVALLSVGIAVFAARRARRRSWWRAA